MGNRRVVLEQGVTPNCIRITGFWLEKDTETLLFTTEVFAQELKAGIDSVCKVVKKVK